VLGLTITSPSVRRGMRDARTAMRLSLVLARAARKRMGETPW
jgi:hypothetical protein